MKKLFALAAAGLLISSLPFAAMAHGGKDNKEKLGAKINNVLKLKGRSVSGSVTAISNATSSTFTVLAKNGGSYTIQAANAKILSAFEAAIPFSQIKISDKVSVKGTISGNVITASKIVVTPANTHKASGKGQVTAVNGNNFTVQTTHHGIVSSFNVVTSSSTIFIKKGATTTTSTLASVQVGSQIKVKGLWDEILNVLNAFRVKIR